ncbi:MAG: hypothetical protein ACE5F1_22355 [Planctomycetota bacterium]
MQLTSFPFGPLAKRLSFAVFLALAPALASGQTPTLVKDINTVKSGPIASSWPGGFVRLGGGYLFNAVSATAGRELFVTTGLPKSVKLLKAINPGLPNSSPSVPVILGNKAYFSAVDATHGRELWVTGGTPAGTQLVLDINPGPAAGCGSIVVLGTKLFLFGGTASQPGLWSSDGTKAGTKFVTRVSFTWLNHVTSHGGKIYFQTYTSKYGAEPWVSDGTAAGTYILKDVWPGGGRLGSFPKNFTPAARYLYFTASRGTTPQLYRSDGTPAGTILIRTSAGRHFRRTPQDLNPGPPALRT